MDESHDIHEKRKKSQRERSKRYRDKNRARLKEQWRQEKRDFYRTDKGFLVSRSWYLRKQFGITLEQYDEMHKSQGGVCSICAKPEVEMRGMKVKHLAVDHCHRTGKIRGLLCQRCNKMLGYSRDNPRVLLAAVEYLNATGWDK